jgi:hypothetical protein
MILFIDMDGVIVDFIGGVEDWYQLDLSGHMEFGFDYEAMGMTGIEFWQGLTDEFWQGLKFTPWGQLLLLKLEEFNPIILSDAARDNAGGKQKWLKAVLPGYHSNGRYLLGTPKWAVAGPGKILIDDYDKHCTEWFQHGGDAILFPRRWNVLRHMSKWMNDGDRIGYVVEEVKRYASRL